MSDFPIIQSEMTIPWNVAEQAFLGYEKKYGRGQSLETIARRGGFGVEEMDEFHPEWREHIKLKALAASRLELLRRVAKLVDPVACEPGECVDCDLMREVMKELGDD